jgi:hypothetical protein
MGTITENMTHLTSTARGFLFFRLTSMQSKMTAINIISISTYGKSIIAASFLHWLSRQCLQANYHSSVEKTFKETLLLAYISCRFLINMLIKALLHSKFPRDEQREQIVSRNWL